MCAKPTHNSTSQMPIETKKFIQKLIDRQTASVDMTRFGFIHESHPMRLFLKPLRCQIQKIHGKSETLGRSELNCDRTDADATNESMPMICKYIEEKKKIDKKKRRKSKLSTE